MIQLYYVIKYIWLKGIFWDKYDLYTKKVNIYNCHSNYSLDKEWQGLGNESSWIIRQNRIPSHSEK